MGRERVREVGGPMGVYFSVEEEIIELEVPIDDLVVVKELDAEHHACGVEDGARLVEDVLVDVHHEIAAARVLHHETHVLLHTHSEDTPLPALTTPTVRATGVLGHWGTGAVGINVKLKATTIP